MYNAMAAGEAEAAVNAAYAAGMRYFDTAPLYGYGLSENRLGEAIAQLPRSEVVVSSKVGYHLVPVEASEVSVRWEWVRQRWRCLSISRTSVSDVPDCVH